jgi:hypothetical protein
MRRPPPAFNKSESAILIAIYEEPNVPYTSYTLARKLSPTTKVGTPDHGVAFTETRDTTEELIVRGLVRGKRLKGADGIYFNDLKLTTKGERQRFKNDEGLQNSRKHYLRLLKMPMPSRKGSGTV